MQTLSLGIYQQGTQWERPITITPADWREHFYCAGKTGMGKSNLLKNLMRQMPAFCLIDGEGDLARSVADSRECIYWRARDFEFPVGINPLLDVPVDERSRITAEIVALFSDIWGLGEHTPQLIHWLRATVRALLDAPGSTLLDIAPMLTDADFRGIKLERCKDRWARSVWREFNAKKPKEQQDEVRSLLNKAHALAYSLPLQLTLGQAVSTLDFRKAMDERRTVICDLSGVGEEPMRLLGAVILFCASRAAAERFDEAVARGTVDTLADYPMVIDEFEDFASLTMPRILAKYRKRRFPLTIAHQYVSQLDPKVADAIFANCGTLMTFRVGVNDAPILASALDAPEDELKDLQRGTAWLAYQKDGVRASAIPIVIPLAKLPTGYLQRNIKITQIHRRNLDEWQTWKRRKERLEREAREGEAVEENKERKKVERRRKFKSEGATNLE